MISIPERTEKNSTVQSGLQRHGRFRRARAAQELLDGKNSRHSGFWGSGFTGSECSAGAPLSKINGPVFSITWPGSFWVCFGFVFSTGANLKDFSGSFSGSFRLTYVVFAFVFNNFSALFSKIRYLFFYFSPGRSQNRPLFYRIFSRPRRRYSMVFMPEPECSFSPPAGSARRARILD